LSVAHTNAIKLVRGCRAGSEGTTVARRCGMNIDQTADIHPSVILERLLPSGRTRFEAANIEASIKREKGL